MIRSVVTVAILSLGSGLSYCQGTVCDPRDFGASADGQTNDQQAIQAAIDTCAVGGGGTVPLSSGVFLSAPIFLKTNIAFRLDADAVLLGTQNPDDYQWVPGMPVIGRSILALVNAGSGQNNVTITGTGTVDGNGAWWWENHLADRPRLMQFYQCQQVTVEGVVLTNSPSLHLVPSKSQDITIQNLTITAPANAPNTDGIDPSDSRNVNISNCTIDVGDDNIAIKAGHIDPDHPGESSADITITNCTFLHGHGVSIGTELQGGLRRMAVTNCSFQGTDFGIRIKSDRSKGGEVAFVTYDGLVMDSVKNPIVIEGYYPESAIPPPFTDTPQPVTATTPNYHDLTIQNISATGTTNPAGKIVGVPELPFWNVTLKNVIISDVPTGMWLRNASITRSNVQIVPRAGEPFLLQENALIIDQ